MISSSKPGHGGARPNSGGARPNSGGARANSGGYRLGAGAKSRTLDLVPIPDILRWYCIRTAYGADLAADIAVRLAGFAVLTLSIWRPAMPARRNANGSVRPAKPDRIEPLFRRYLLVQFRRSDPWRSIRRIDGVEAILGSADTPAAIPEAAIALIRSLPGFAPNGCIYPPEPHIPEPRELAIGRPVRLLRGPMSGLTGICEWSDRRRVGLLMAIMGASVAITVPFSAVEAI